MTDKIAKVINCITTVLVVLVVALAVALIAGKPFGVHAFSVLSGSMEPAYSTGDLIYVKEVEPSELQPGDPITFMTGKDATVTHRIVELVPCEDGVTRFRTQGDANSVVDGELVHPDNVIGVPIFAVPILGYLINFVQYPPGLYIAISFCAVVVFLMFLPDLLPGKKDEEEDEEGMHYPQSGLAASKGLREKKASHPAYAESLPKNNSVSQVRSVRAATGAGRTQANSTSARRAAGVSQPPRKLEYISSVSDRPQQARPAVRSSSCLGGSNNPRLKKKNAAVSSSLDLPERRTNRGFNREA